MVRVITLGRLVFTISFNLLVLNAVLYVNRAIERIPIQ